MIQQVGGSASAMCDDERNIFGVRRREGPGGDVWANEHRYRLSRWFTMLDLDGIMGVHLWSQNPESQINRRYGLVSLFDRKGGRASLDKPWVPLSRAFHVWLCNAVGSVQRVMPKFFYTVGESIPGCCSTSDWIKTLVSRRGSILKN